MLTYTHPCPWRFVRGPGFLPCARGAWKVDISQGYSFILTVEGADGSFEGESYGTWSNIEVDPRTGSLKASWVSGKYSWLAIRVGRLFRVSKLAKEWSLSMRLYIRYTYIYIYIYIYETHD